MRINELRKQLPKLPDGQLLMRLNGKYAKWYLKGKRKTKYIPHSKLNMARQLAEKSLLQQRINCLETENMAIERCLEMMLPRETKESRMIASEHFKRLLNTEEQDPHQSWSLNYERNQKYPEGLIHKSASGNILRSKSEVLIDLALYQHNIPYRYEAALNLDDITLWPDFTIMHPITEKILYWEHFGMVDDEEYVNICMKKQKLYIANGIIPNVNLIMTFETKDNPLTAEQVERVIANYLLE